MLNELGKDMADVQHYTEQWLQKTEAPAGIVENDLRAGLATRLYLGCMQILKSICGDFAQTVREESLAQAQADLLKPELGKFFLWGESRCDGSLDDAVDKMDAVKCMVLRLLCDIAEELLACKSHVSVRQLTGPFCFAPAASTMRPYNLFLRSSIPICVLKAIHL